MAAPLIVVLVAAACSSSNPPTGGAAATTTPAGPKRSVSAPEKAPVATVKAPTISGPVTGGTYNVPFNPLPPRLAQQYGYREEEFFLDGTAQSYDPQGTWTQDGMWAVTPASTAPYKTRVLVRRPIDPAAFNGVVLVEWLNVSSGMDADPDFGFARDELLRGGYAWVGVSAQKVGVEGGFAPVQVPGIELLALKQWDPQRYRDLQHPGDEFSYDIFSQAGAALIKPTGADPLGGLRPRRLLAAGESQSSFRMVTYVNAIQPVAKVYDGFLVHSRGPVGAPLNATPSPAAPKVARIRDDITTPVLQLETETDLFGLGFYPARQPDTAKLRTWEVAGTAHADQFTLDYGIESGHVWNPDVQLDFNSLCGRINDGPQTWVVRRAIADLAAWSDGGPPPAAGPPLEIMDGKIARDADGNALGGIRMPAVEVPTEQLSGEADTSKSVICSLFGTSAPFPPDKLASLYPTRQAYVDKVKAAAQQAVDAGFLLPADQTLLVQQAEEAKVPA